VSRKPALGEAEGYLHLPFTFPFPKMPGAPSLDFQIWDTTAASSPRQSSVPHPSAASSQMGGIPRLSALPAKGELAPPQVAEGQLAPPQVAEGQLAPPQVAQVAEGQLAPPQVAQVAEGQLAPPQVAQVAEGQLAPPQVAQVAGG